ncbi:MAG: RraA family protein [Streptosporangiales bacterium]|nr:RraA family protein [Streptosporangiales bacterium]
MALVINRSAPQLPAGLAEAVAEVDVPTFGHFLEAGFPDPAIRRLAGSGRMVGRAVTVRITATDSTLVHQVTSMVGPGDVVVVDTGGDGRHAPVGGVVGHALATAGAVGVVIDGVCTDVGTLRELGLSVYARGTSALTTKLHGIDAGGINVPITCGGSPVEPGYLVSGDDNGVLLAAPADVAAVLDRAAASDAAEPGTLAKLHAGATLLELTAARRLLSGLGVELAEET